MDNYFEVVTIMIYIYISKMKRKMDKICFNFSYITLIKIINLNQVPHIDVAVPTTVCSLT